MTLKLPNLKFVPLVIFKLLAFNRQKFWLSPLNMPTPRTPYWVLVYGLYLLHNASYRQFCVTICDFSLPWQQGHSEQFVWHPEMCRLWIPPKWCRYLGYMPYTTWVIAIFVLKFANFYYHVNRGRSEQFLTVTFKQADPKTPYWVQVYGLYLLSKASHSQFCVEICNFSLSWQQGRSSNFFTYTGVLADPNTLP